MKFKSLEKLKDLADLFSALRQAGHTTAMVDGAADTDCFVITHNASMRDYMMSLGVRKKKNIITINQLRCLYGMNKSILVDHVVYQELSWGAYQEVKKYVQKLEEENVKYREIIDKIKDIVSKKQR